MSQALTCNMNLREGAEPFTADDFLGLSDREARQKQRDSDALKATMADRATVRQIKRFVAGEDLPEWLPDFARPTPAEQEALAKEAMRKRRN